MNESPTTPQQPATLLFVDDEPNILRSLQRLFRSADYIIHTAESGAAALEILHQQAVDLIISDMRMPQMNGAEFLEHAANEWPETIRILLTGFADIESTIAAVNKGKIYSYLNKPWEDNELKIQVAHAIEQKRMREERQQLFDIINTQNAELKDLNTHLEDKIEQRTAQLKSTLNQLDGANKSLEKQYTDTVIAFAKIIEMRPGIKSGRSKYIAEKAVLVARELGMSAEEKKNILYAGLLIQIGKMSLPDTLLAQPFYSMSPVDQHCYLRHAVEGEALLKGLTQLKGASLLIRHQYERYDGSGFPDGLAKQNIPLGARIINVVGDYIAYLEGSMTAEAMPVSTVLSRLMVRKGSYYDPEVIDAFIEVLKDTTVEVELPAVEKSWKTSCVVNEQTVAVARPVIEILWTQLRSGMEVEGVYFENKPYIRNCIVNQKIIQTIATLRDNTGKNPIVKIRLGAR